MKDRFFICKRCLSKFEIQSSNCIHYWVAFVGVVLLWQGVSRVFPGYFALTIALFGLFVAYKAITVTLGFGKLKRCPSCSSDEIIPETSPGGLEIQVKAQLIERTLVQKYFWSGLGSLSAVFGCFLMLIALANDDKYRLEYTYKQCIDQVNDYEKRLAAKRLKHDDYSIGEFVLREHNLKQAAAAKEDCEKILWNYHDLPNILVEGNIKIPVELMDKTTGITTAYIIFFDQWSKEFDILGAAKIAVNRDQSQSVHFSIKKDEFVKMGPRRQIPRVFTLKARFDKDGLGGKENPGDLTGYVESVPLGSREVEVLLDKLIE